MSRTLTVLLCFHMLITSVILEPTTYICVTDDEDAAITWHSKNVTQLLDVKESQYLYKVKADFLINDVNYANSTYMYPRRLFENFKPTHLTTYSNWISFYLKLITEQSYLTITSSCKSYLIQLKKINSTNTNYVFHPVLVLSDEWQHFLLNEENDDLLLHNVNKGVTLTLGKKCTSPEYTIEIKDHLAALLKGSDSVKEYCIGSTREYNILFKKLPILHNFRCVTLFNYRWGKGFSKIILINNENYYTKINYETQIYSTEICALENLEPNFNLTVEMSEEETEWCLLEAYFSNKNDKRIITYTTEETIYCENIKTSKISVFQDVNYGNYCDIDYEKFCGDRCVICCHDQCYKLQTEDNFLVLFYTYGFYVLLLLLITIFIIGLLGFKFKLKENYSNDSNFEIPIFK